MKRQFDKPIQVRLTLDEYEEINRQADAKATELGLAKLSLSDYVRWLINYHNRDKKEGRG